MGFRQLRNVFFVTFLFASASALSQPFNYLSAVHTTPAQNSITVTLTGNLTGLYTGGTLTNWIVTIGGVNQTPTSVVGTNPNNFITITFATPVGIDPITHKGKTVTVTHSVNDGTITTFTAQPSVNNRHLQCGDFTAITYNDVSGTCAPVDPVSFMVFSVSPVARNSSFWDMARNTGRITWGSSTSNSVINMRETNSAGTTTTDSYFISLYTADDGTNFNYPSNDNLCGYSSNWNVRLVYLPVGGLTTNCGILQALQTQVYSSHNNDDTGISTGATNADVLLPATVANSDLVCRGTNASMTFSDGTFLNCNPQTAPIPTNDKVRWIRVVYGSQNLGSGAVAGRNIPDVHVNGVEVTTSTGVLNYPSGYSPPVYPFGTPDAFGVVQLTTPVAGNRGVLDLITTTTLAPFTNQVVGQKFWVRIDYWNTCNPYDGSGGLVVNNKKSIENDIEIVSIPAAPTPSAQSFTCNGATPADFSISNVTPGTSTVHWYQNISAATPKALGTVGTEFATPAAVGGNSSVPVSTTSNPGYSVSTANNYIVWASYSSTPGGISCESPKVAITRSVKELLDFSTAPLTLQVSTGTVCAGATGVVFTVRNGASAAIAPATQPVGGTTEYFWTVPAGWTITSGGGSTTTTTASIMVDIGNTATSGSASVVWRYTDDSCPTVTPITRALTVNPQPVITPAAQATCDDVAFSFTPTTSIASTYSWTFGNMVGTITGAANGTNAATFSQTLSNSSSLTNASLDYTITPRSTGTLCTGQAVVFTLTVYPKPVITSYSATAVCSDADVLQNFAASNAGTIATSTYSVTAVALGAATQISGGTGTYTAAGLQTHRFRNLTNSVVNVQYTVTPISAQPCSGVAFTLTIPVNPEPVMNSIVISPAVCSKVVFGGGITLASGGQVNTVPITSYTINSVTATSLTVSAGTAGATGAGFAAGVISDDAWRNVSGSDRNAVYNASPVATTTGCIGDPFTVDVPIRRMPVLTAPAVTVLCSDIATGATLPASTTVAASTYTIDWTMPVDVTASAGGPADGSGFAAGSISDDAYTNVNATNRTVTYSVFGVASGGNGGCAGEAISVDFTIRPEPVVANMNPTAICSDINFGSNFAASSTVSADSYIVTNIVLNGMTGSVNVPSSFPSAALINTDLANDAFTNITGSQQDAVYTVTPRHAYVTPTQTCAGNSFTITLPVNSGPSVSTQNIAAICSDAAVGVNFGATTNGVSADRYTIVARTNVGLTPGGTVEAVGTGNLLNTALANDTYENLTSVDRAVVYTIRPRNTASGCDGPTFTVNLTIHPEPVVAAQPITLCSDDAVGVSFTAGSNVTATTYNVTSVDNPSALPFANVVIGDQAITGLANDVWTNLTSVNRTVTYHVLPRTVDNCVGAEFLVTLTVRPEPVGTNAAAPALCSGASVGYNLQIANINAAGGNSVPSSFSWIAASDVAGVTGESFGASHNTVTIDDILVNTSGTDATVIYNVIPTATTGTCVGSQFTVSVLVRGPTVTIGGAATQSICSGSGLPLTAVEAYTSGSFTARKWTGLFDPAGAAPQFALTDTQMSNILGGGLNSLTPTFNSNGDAISTGLSGQFQLTLTSTDSNTPACTANDVVIINVSQIVAGILHGPTVGTATNPALTETVCNSTNVFLNGNPSGGSGVYSTHTWSVASSTPIAVVIGSVMSGAAAATVNPTFNYTNATAAPVTIVLRYAVVDNAGCNFNTGSNATDISITVNPTPTVTDPADPAVCTGVSTTLVTFSAAPNNVAGTFFEWTNSNTSIGLAASGTGNIAAFPTTNITNVVQTASIVVTPKMTNVVTCAGSTQTFTIDVNPKPTIANVPATDICSADAFSHTPVNGGATIVPAGTFYTWTAPTITPNAGSVTNASAGGGAGVFSIGQTNLINTTNVTQQLVYTVTPKAGAAVGGCTGTDFTVTINVKPKPFIDDRSTTICSGTGAFTVTPVNGIGALGANPLIIVPAGISYSWTVPAHGGVTGEANGSGASVTQTLVNTTNTPQTVVYTVTPSAGTTPTCTGPTFTVTVRVDPRPAIDLRTQTICSGTAFAISPVNAIANGGGADATVIVPTTTTYTWTVTSVTPGGLAAVTGHSDQLVQQPNIGQTLTNVTSINQVVRYTATPKSTDLGLCTGSTFFVDITVNPKPLITDIVQPTICSGSAFTVTLTNNPPTTIIPVGTTYTWTVLDILPTAGSVDATAQGPAGVSVISQTLTNSTNVLQTVRYTVTPATVSCTGPTFVVTVPVTPKPAIPTQNVAICSGAIATFTITNGLPTAATIYPAGTTFTWSAPGAVGVTGMTAGTNQASFTQTLTNSGVIPRPVVYSVTPSIGGICPGSPFTVNVTVNPIPKLSNNPSIPTFPEICSGNFSFNPASATPGATFVWSRAFVPGITESASASAGFPTPGTGVISETLTNTTSGAIDVTYAFITNANSCSSPEDVVVTVNPTPGTNNILGPSSTCVSASIDFFYQVTQNPGSTYSWEIPAAFTRTAAGNGSTPGAGPGPGSPFGPDYFVLIKFPSAAVASLRVFEKSADGCVGLVNPLLITVSGSPPGGTITGPPSVCKNRTGVPYSVPPNVNSTFVWQITSGDAEIDGPTAGTNLHTIIVDFGILPSQIKVTETNLAGCPATYPVVGVSMIDPPAMAGPVTADICSGAQASDVIDLDTFLSVPATFNWFVKSITANVTGAAVNDLGTGELTHAVPLKNISGVDGTIVYTVRPTATGSPFCVGNPVDYTITMKPEPVVTAVLDQAFCGLSGTINGTTSFPFTSNVAGATINWSATNFAAVGLGAGSGTGNMLFTAADNQTGANITSVVTVTATGSGATACLSAGANLKTFNLVIKPRPVVAVIPNVVVCSGGAISSISFTANTGGSENFAWTNNNTAIGLGTNGTVNITGYTAPINVTNLPITATISVTGEKNGCTGPARTFTITVNPQPVVSATLNNTVCSDTDVNLILSPAGSSVAAASYNVVSRTVAGALSTVTLVAVPATGVAANYLETERFRNTTGGNLTVQYVVEANETAFGTCTGATRTITMTISPEPVLSATLNKNVCSDAAIALTLNTNGVSIGAGVYDILSVTPDALLIPVSMAGPGNNVAANYLINDKFRNLTNGALPVVYEVRPQVSAAGCEGDIALVTITINPEPIIDPGLNDDVCSNNVIGLTLSTAAGSASAASYNIISRTLSSGSLTSVSTATVPANAVAPSYLSNDKFQNLSDQTHTVTYRVEPVGTLGSCLGDQVDIVISIDPQPTVASTLSTSVCSGDDVNLTLSVTGTSVAAASYNIVSRTVPGTLITNSAAVVPASGVADDYLKTDNFTNTTSGALNVIYLVEGVGSINSCVGPQRTITITINPEPVIAATLNATVCSQAAIGLTLAVAPTSVTVTGYNITGKVVEPGLTPLVQAVVPATNRPANYLALDKYKNTTDLSLTVEYDVEAIGSLGTACVGQTRTIVITIDPEPVIAAGLDADVCSNDAINLVLDDTAPTGVVAASYNIISRTVGSGLTTITSVAVPASAVADDYLENEVFQNLTTTAKTVVYKVVPVGSINGCLGEQATITMTIFPEPVVSTTLDATKCSGAAINVTLGTLGSSVGASGYNVLSRTLEPGLTQDGTPVIIPGNGVIAAYLAGETFTNITNAPLTVEYEVEAISNLTPACTGAIRIITITINPEPVVATTLDDDVCSGDVTGLILDVEPTSVSALNYNIISRTATGLIPVGTPAVVPALNRPATWVMNDKFENLTGGPLFIVYEVVPVGSINNCAGDQATITITVNPEPVVDNGLNNTVCSDGIVGLVLDVEGGSIPATNWNIVNRIVGAGLTPVTQVGVPAVAVADNYLQNEVYTNTNATARTVQYVVEAFNGCVSNQLTITITINPEPVVSTGLNKSVCSDDAIALTLTTAAGSVTALDYNIVARRVDPLLTQIGAPAVVPATNKPNSYLAAETFQNLTPNALTVEYDVRATGTIGTGCLGDLRTIIVTINPEPVILSTLNASVCSDQAISLTLGTDPAGVSALNYNIIARRVDGGLTPVTQATIANGVNANHLFNEKYTNLTSGTLHVEYDVKARSVLGTNCLSDLVTIVISIDPKPIIASNLDDTKCSDAAVGLTLAVDTGLGSVSAASYNIISRTVQAGLTPVTQVTVPAGAVADNYLSTEVYTNTTNNFKTVQYVVAGVGSINSCVGDTRTITITINPEPVISTGLDKTICSNDAVALTLATNGTSVGVGPLGYTIHNRIVQGGLAPVPATQVTVPQSGVAANYLAGEKYTNLTSGALTVQYVVSGVGTIGTCAGDQRTVTVTINPQPVIPNLNLTVCSDIVTGLTLTTDGIAIGASGYNILTRVVDSGLTPVGALPTVPSAIGVAANYLAGEKYTNVSNASHNVTYTVVARGAIGNCLSDVMTIVVTIDPKPVLTATLNATVCSDAATGLTLSTIGGGIGASGYNIVSRTVDAGLAPVTQATVPANGVIPGYLAAEKYTNATNGPLDVKYSIVPVGTINSCLGAAVTVTITIYPKPVIATNLDGTVCSDAAVALTLNTNGSSIGAASYELVSRVVDGSLTPVAGTQQPLAAGVADNYLVGEKYTNLTAIARTVQYEVRAVGALSPPTCTGDSRIITITINPEPVVSLSLDDNVCSDDATGLTLDTEASSVGASNYNIMSRTVHASLIPVTQVPINPATNVSANYLATEKYRNITTTARPVTYVVRAKGTIGNCVGQTRTITITIDPEPVMSNLDDDVCSNTDTGLTLSTTVTSGPVLNYNILSRTVSGGLTPITQVGVPANAQAAGYLSTERYKNTTNISLTVQYVVEPRGSVNGCLGNQSTITITIDPEPVVASTLSKTVCSDVATGLNLSVASTSVSATTYNIVSRTPDVSLVVVNAPAVANNVPFTFLAGDIFRNTTGGDLDVVYVVTANGSINGCVGDTRTITVTIHPEQVGVVPANVPVCSDVPLGAGYTLSTTPIAAATYNIITTSTGLTQSGGTVSQGTLKSATELNDDAWTNLTTGNLPVTYDVTPVSADGCLGNTFTVTVTIRPEPVGVAISKVPVCSDLTLGTLGSHYTLTSSASAVAATKYNIFTTSHGLTQSAGVVSQGSLMDPDELEDDAWTNTGLIPVDVDYLIVPVSAAGCEGNSYTVSVTINPEPAGVPITTVKCSDEVFGASLFLTSSGASVPASTFNITIPVVPGLTFSGLTPSAGSGKSSSILTDDKWTNITPGPLDIVYQIVPVTGSGCTGTSFDVRVTINPEPIGAPTLPLEICSGGNPNFNLMTIIDDTYAGGNSVAGNGVPSKFKYTVTSSPPAAGVSPGPNRLSATIANITDVYVNTSNVDATITYSVTPVSVAGDCEGTPFDFKITVHPQPVGVTVNDPVCSTLLNHDIQTQITNGLTSRFTYVVTSTDETAVPTPVGLDRVVASTAFITDAYLNTSSAPVTVTYEITPFNDANPTCAGANFFYNVIISPKPQAGDVTKAPVCSNVIFTFDPQDVVNDPSTTPPGNSVVSTFTWTAVYDAGVTVVTPGAGTGSISERLINRVNGNTTLNATYTVIPSKGSCVGNPFDIVVPILPEPVMSTSLNEIKCSDLTYGKLLDTNGVSVTSATYDILANSSEFTTAGLTPTPTTGTGLLSVAIQNDAFTNPSATQLRMIYTVTPRAANLCYGDAKVVEFRVNPEPVMNPTLATGNVVCSDVPLGMILSTNGSSVAASSFIYNALLSAPATPVAPQAGNAIPDPTETGSGDRVASVIVADSYTNTDLTGASLNRIYRVKPKSSQGCLGDLFDITVQVLPEPDFAFVAPTPLCTNDAINLAMNQVGATAIQSYQITEVTFDSAPSPGLIPGATNNGVGTYTATGGNYTIAGSYINGTNATLQAHYKVIPIAVAVSGKQCLGNERTENVSIRPSPIVLTNLDKVVCNDATNGVTITTTPSSAPSASFEIIRDPLVANLVANVYTPGTIVVTGAATNNIGPDRVINNDNNPLDVTYRIRANTDANPALGCYGPVEVILVKVEPQFRVTLDATTNLSPLICSGEPTNIVMSSPSNPSTGGVSFNFAGVSAVSGAISGLTPGFGLNEGDVIGDINTFPQTLVNNSNSDVVVTYTVTPKAGSAGSTPGGCAGIPSTTQVTVHPKPKVTVPAFKTICEGTSVAIALNSPTISTPTVAFHNSASVDAPGAAADISGITAGGDFANSTTIGDILNSNVSASRTVTYTLTPFFGTCVGDAVSSTITVSPRPVLNPVADFEICSGEVFNPITMTYDTDPSVTMVSWSVVGAAGVTGAVAGSGDEFSQVLFNGANTSRTILYSFTATNIENLPQCAGSVETVNVTVYPIPAITGVPSSKNVCFGEAVSVPLASTKLNTVYNWTVDNGADADLPVIGPGSASGATPAINQTFLNNGTDLKSYSYTITPSIVMPTRPVTEACVGNDRTLVVNVAPQIQATLANASGGNEIFLCTGSKDFLYFTFGGHPNFDYTYQEGSTVKTVTKKGFVDLLTVQPATTTTYTLLSAKDAFGCTRTFNQTVTVNVDQPNANFTVVEAPIQCGPFDYHFDYTKRAGVTYVWKWGDGTEETQFSSTNPPVTDRKAHTYTNLSPSSTARFRVTMETYLDTTKYIAGCLKRLTQDIRLHPQISAAVFPDKEVICSDEQVSFVNSSQGATIHKWYYRVQGATSEVDPRTSVVPSNYMLPNHTSSNPLVLEVVYEANNAAGCKAAAVVTPITVYRGVEAAFTHTTPTVFVAGNSNANFTNTSSPVDGADFRYDWDFGLNANPVNPSGVGPFRVDYATPGPKEIVLIATNKLAESLGLNCADEFRETMEIIVPPLVAKFTVIPEVACFPTDLTVTENLATGDKFAWRVLDDGGTAASSNAVLPVFKVPSPGVYTVELVTTNSFTGDTKSETVDVTIYDLPMASFDVRPSIVFAPDGEVETFNFSDGATDYEWDFGDGDLTEADRIAEEPKHTYKVEGMYTITMIAKNDHGKDALGKPVVCVDTLTRKVIAKQGGVTRVPNAFTPSPGGSTAGRGTPGLPGSNSFNDVFLPQVKGAEEFNMQVFDRWGNLIFESNSANEGWDGYDRNGALMPAGVYVYKLTLRLSDGQRTTQVGDITMIR